MSSIENLFERHGPAYRVFGTGTVMIAAIAVVLSTTIVNVAIPDVMRAFAIGQVQAQWISTGFLAAMTATMLMTDWCDRAFGLRASMIGALVVFTGGSVLGGLAPNEHVLTLARVIQGAAAGVTQPLAMVLLFRIFPANRRGAAMGIFGVGVVLAPAIGPWVGGILVDTFDWRAVFYLGIPFAIVAIGLSALFLPTRATAGPRSGFDWIGTVFLCTALGFVLNALTNGQRDGWDSPAILAQFAIAAVAAVAFVGWELRTAKPMLDLKLFVDGPFVAASLIGFILGAGLFGSTYLVPLFVQTLQGMTPTQAGLLLMPSGFALVLTFPIAGWISDKVAPGLLIGGGLAVFAYATYLTESVDINTGFWALAWWTALSRLGLGFIFPSLTAASLKVLPLSLVAQGSGSMNFIRQLGGAFGVNLLAVFLERRTHLHADELAAAQGRGDAATTTLLEKIAALPDIQHIQQLPRTVLVLGRAVALHAYTLAFQDGFRVVTALFVIALIPTWMLHRALKRGSRRSGV